MLGDPWSEDGEERRAFEFLGRLEVYLFGVWDDRRGIVSGCAKVLARGEVGKGRVGCVLVAFISVEVRVGAGIHEGVSSLTLEYE
jgi:hypothetical protein